MTILLARSDLRLGAAETEALLAQAARIVPPLWPLDGAIAVNPLGGLEHLPFEEALRQGADLFDARTALPLPAWRRIVADGRLDRAAVRMAAIERLGGLDAAFRPLGPDLTLLDCLMARLFDLPERASAAPAADPAALVVAKWCALFFDAGNAASAMPGRAQGLYRAVSALLPHDRTFAALGEDACLLLARAPADAVEAVGAALAQVVPPARRATLERLIARLPGWAGHLRWRTEHAEADAAAGAPATMADLVALLQLCDAAAGGRMPTPHRADPDACAGALRRHFSLAASQLVPALPEVAALDEADLGMIFQAAAERQYRDALVGALTLAPPAAPNRPDAQLLFCIDVRSEPLRRALEAEGAYETFGYAGFFGLPIALRTPDGRRIRHAPVLIAPPHDIAMVPDAGAAHCRHAHHAATVRRDLFGRLKTGAATGFALAEATGPIAAASMIARTFLPEWTGARAGRADPRLAPVLDAHGGPDGLRPEERIGYARALFTLTGMSRRTARLVVLVGHCGTATNNPYASALDCGACAGHGGAPNARIMAAILNDPAVRDGLAADGEALPADSWFVAAEHNTTTDAMTLFDLDRVPASHAPDLDRLQAALDRAGAANRVRRAGSLRRTPGDLAVGAAHWGEVRPEWGLTGAAAFIVGPRWLTRHADLDGRAFLHSYDWQADSDGEALATILTAPMVVGQWISCQYLFSTLDNDRYGAGDKTIHNPVGRIGVMRGNGGDLCVGLPRQSLFRDDGAPAHVPQRLLALVHAPLDRVAQVIEGAAVLRRLFGNGWVQLVAIDPQTGRTRRWRADREMMPDPAAIEHEGEA